LEASLRAERPPEAGRKRVQEDLRLARADRPPGPGLIVTPEGAAELPPLTGGADAKWEGRIGIEALHDSNPALVSGDLPFPIFGMDEPASDIATQLDLRLGYQPFQGRRGWSLGLDVSGSHSTHQDLDELDLSLARGTVSLGWKSGGRFTVLLQGSGARAWLGGDSYLDLAEGSVSFGFRETAWTATRIEVEVRDRSFEPALTDFFHGGREASLGLSQSFSLGRPDRQLRLGARAAEVSGTLGSDAEIREALAEIAAPLSSRWAVVLAGSWAEQSFDHGASNFVFSAGPARDDDLWRVSAASAYRLTPRVQWTARASWAERDSNVELFASQPLLDYRRTVVATGLGWSFR
ncbi:MAG TPA: hypothetical protein VF756_13585, partial [Thermoanaerobaculia bacterium]